MLQWQTVVHKDSPARHKVDRQGQKHQETMPCAGPGHPHASAFGEWWLTGPEGGVGESRKEGGMAAKHTLTTTPSKSPVGLTSIQGGRCPGGGLAWLEGYPVAIFSYTHYTP